MRLPILCSLAAFALPGGAAPVPVKIVPGQGLERGGKPYFIKGAGGSEHLEELVKRGGNSIRTWSTDGLGTLLDKADKLGLTVCAGIWLEPECAWFSYKNAEHCARQTERVRKAVREFREHPALLFWGLGNEAEGDGKNAAYWQQLDRLARMVREEDPAHPTFTAVAGLQPEKAAGMNQYAPSLDFVGINTYGALPGLRQHLADLKWTRPWVVTEFGPLGPWERPKTAWGAAIEQTAGEKAAMLRKGYEASIAQGGNCWGSYAFLWGHKQESTPTWFSLLSPEGEVTASVDALTEIWSGKPPANRVPEITAFQTAAAKATFRKGETFTATGAARDPDGDTLKWQWTVVPESAGRDQEGRELPVQPIQESIARPNSADVEGRAPAKRGNYRLFLKVTDGKGGMATENVPFRVVE
jgi:hypothetical protein